MLNKTIAIALCLVPCALAAQTFTPAEAVNNILQNNTELQALSAGNAADSLSLADGAKALSPIDLEFEHLWGQGEKKWNLGVTQSFDWPGVYSKRREASRAAASALSAQWQARASELTAEARLGIADMVYATKRLELLRAIRTNVARLQETTETAHKHGEVNIVDVKKIRLELADIDWQITDLQNELSDASSRIASLNGGSPMDIDCSGYQPFTLDNLDSYLSAANPEAEALRLSSRAAVADGETAAAERLPGLSLGYRHAFEENIHFNGLAVGVSIPWQSRGNARRIAAGRAASLDLEAQNRIESRNAEIRALHKTATSLRSRLDALTSVALDDTYPALLDMAYRGGEMNLITYLQELNYYLDSRNNLLEAEYKLRTALIALNKYN